uniref:SWIM-type domain-containing protein n=1 Tax=Acrobeloides nanus TaxID=290746 RepID=A0A914DHJ5_9BILA
SWSEYQQNRLKFHTITPNIENRLYECTCPVGIRKKPCKHSTMLMVNDSIFSYPPSTVSKPIEAKRKRGRPSKATKALSKN